MGRKPITLDEEQRAQVEALAACLSQDQIADYLGTSRPTFAAIMERDPDVSLRYKRGKAKAIQDVAEGLLMKARGGDTASAIFYLKTQAGWRETIRNEHSGPDGKPIQTEDVSADADAFTRRLSGLAATTSATETDIGADD